MLILHVVNHSLVRYTPARIGTYWGRYTEHNGMGLCTNRPGGPGQFREPLNPQGVFYCRGYKEELAELCERADVIHCHDDIYPTKLPNWESCKALVYHAHIGDIPQRIFRTRRVKYHHRVKHACITNGYGRHFDKEAKRSGVPWGRLPDIMDLDHPVYCPDWEARKRNDKFTVVFTYSNNHEPGRKINAKGPVAHKNILEPLKRQGVDVRLITKVKFEQSMAEKARAHIVLDEIFSPYTHLSALEGAAAGACVMTNYDAYTRDDLCNAVGAPVDSYPFVKVTPKTIVDKILYYRDHREEADQIGRAGRAWLEKYYGQRKLLQQYLEFYELA